MKVQSYSDGNGLLTINTTSLRKDSQKGYTRSVLSRFSKRVGEENINKIIDNKVAKLLKEQQTGEVDVVLDTSFIQSLEHSSSSRQSNGLLGC
jgi:hypothetical protein